MRRLVRGCGVVVLVLAPLLAAADVGPPAHLRITEREPGLFTVQWRVPKVLPPRAVPVPQFPDSCRSAGERSVVDQAGAWLITQDWRCESRLAGESVGMQYPFPDLALTTVARVDLLSGDRYAHVLTPGQGLWRIPEGTAPPDPIRAASSAALSGASHVLGSWAHLAFLLAVGLLGEWRQSIRVVSVFTVGQLAGALAAWPAGGIGVVPAEIGLAVVVALLAREALRPAEKRRRLRTLAGLAGVVHGLAVAGQLAGRLGDDGARIGAQLLAILGMDAVHLVGAVAVTALVTSLVPATTRLGRGLCYGAGAAGTALAIGLAVGGAVDEPTLAPFSPPTPAQPSSGPGSAAGASRRVAPAVPDAPIQSFLAVEPFEVRHEVMLRLAGLAGELGLHPESTLEVDAQAAVSERLVSLALDSVTLQVDGTSVAGIIRRAHFMSVDATGALPRTVPMPESVSDAVLGVVVVYPTQGMPRAVSLSWDPFPSATAIIPATVIDPESVQTVRLSAEDASLSWTNALTEDPIPTVAAVEVEPQRLPLPLLSLPLLAGAAVVLVAGVRRRRFSVSMAAARVFLALAIIVGPVAQPAVAVPGSAGRAPSDGQARRILAGLLPNIYRALEFRDEALIYDWLAVSVTGDALTDVYLQQRRALELEERGGARARVETVEILEAGEIARHSNGFGVRSTWKVGGMVTHFGHRHFRQNRYNARIEIVAEAGAWKVRSIEVLEQERVQ